MSSRSGTASPEESVDGVVEGGDVSSGATSAGRSFFNLSEVAAVQQLLKQVLAGGHLTPGDIGVITPYAGQVRMMVSLALICLSCCCCCCWCGAAAAVSATLHPANTWRINVWTGVDC
jgi:hypothetical protein